MLPRPIPCCAFLLALSFAVFPTLSQTPPAKPAPTTAPSQSNQKKPVPSPPAPQSKHYPILLIASGTEPFWSLRIGMKGAERFERVGYPPIPLDPVSIEHRGRVIRQLTLAPDGKVTEEEIR